jgi:hypothetical protein
MNWFKKIFDAYKKGETIHAEIELDERHLYLIIAIVILTLVKILL